MQDAPEQDNTPHQQCLNCGAPVAGLNYCAVCGQKSTTRVLRFRELIEEFMDGLFNMDSRLWHSLVPLVIAPGRLTNEYLRGRRQFYLPPFRIYLILSVLFFLIPNTSLDPRGADPDFDGAFLRELDSESQALQAELTNEFNGGGTQGAAAVNSCLKIGAGSSALPVIQLRLACQKFIASPGTYYNALADTMPVVMILTIPLAAVLMQLLYALQGRRYVEHVVFLFHIHAFLFMVSILMGLASLLGMYYDWLSSGMNLFRVIAAWYIPVYVFLAMARVYGGSRTGIFFKALLVITGYLILFASVTLIGALVTVLRF